MQTRACAVAPEIDGGSCASRPSACGLHDVGGVNALKLTRTLHLLLGCLCGYVCECVCMCLHVGLNIGTVNTLEVMRTGGKGSSVDRQLSHRCGVM
jgi:hypothetical protein